VCCSGAADSGVVSDEQPGMEEMFARLMSAFYVEIFDPCWGRKELLWPTLRSDVGGAAAGRCDRPVPI
jgi:hypothetical protein